MNLKRILNLILILWMCQTCGGWKHRLFSKSKPMGGENGGSNINNSGVDMSSSSSSNNIHNQHHPYDYAAAASFFRQSRDSIFQPWEQLLYTLKEIIYFEPPVGIVTLVCVMRLVFSGRLFRVFSDTKLNTATDVLNQSEENNRRHTGGSSRNNRYQSRHRRALNLDQHDMSYDSQGGVESVRCKLCQVVVRQCRMDAPDDEYLKHILSAIHVTYSGRESRTVYIKEIAKHLVQAGQSQQQQQRQEQLQQQQSTSSSSSSRRRAAAAAQVDQNTNSTINDDDLAVLVEMAYTVAELRALDALLRTSRDRLLTTCSKLKRLVQYWQSRVKLVTKVFQGRIIGKVLSVFSGSIGKHYVQDDRERLALAKGAYRDELERLGKTQAILNEKPKELSESKLIEAVAQTRNMITAATSDSMQDEPSWFSKFAIRWNVEGSGRLSIRYLDQKTTISSTAAQYVLLDQEHQQQKDNAKEWIKETQSWIQMARSELCSVLRESVKTNIVNANVKRHVANLDEWCAPVDASTTGWNKHISTDQQWDSVLEMVDTLDEHQRVGEGTVVRFRDRQMVKFLQNIDFFGIPSCLATIGFARLIHEYLEPKWPEIQSILYQGYDVVWTIIQKRVWTPLKDILVNLASRKNQSLLEFFDVNNEVTSLDNMLRDLGFGDGTEATREAALHLASRRYEQDLESGLFRNVVRGRLIRLLLVQVQQLKAGMLHALDSIDVLVAANRLNVQLLAAIPAVLIMTLGVRFVGRSMYTFRIKAIRSIRDVHAEMQEYLDDMEHLLLLTDDSVEYELGNFILHMHTYLVLLDYASPLFPARAVDAIHKSMQDILSIDPVTITENQKMMGSNRQVQILRLIKEKHVGLLKYL